jgi:hypothetical protein
MACPVCFAGEDAAVRESLNLGIGVLLAVTFVVLGFVARFIVVLGRRSRDAAHLVDHAPSRPARLDTPQGTPAS